MVKLLTSSFKYFFVIIFLLLTQSCSYIQNKPMALNTRTEIIPNTFRITNSGSLFQDAQTINYGYQPLFEDYKPHNIGDTITVVLQENISASNSSSSNISRDGTANLGVNISPGQLNPMLGLNINDNRTGFDSIGKNDFSGKGSNSAKNTFNGLITVTIKQVLPNGNLKVCGEKEVSINQGTEFIHFSGVVNPNNINKNNLVASTQIADTKIEYLSNGNMNEINKMGWFQRFLLKISPV